MSSKIIGFCLSLSVFFIACKKPATPQEQVKGYLAAVDSMDYRNAATYVFKIEKEDIEYNEQRVADMKPRVKQEMIDERKSVKYAFTEQDVTDTKAKVVVYEEHYGKITPISFKLKKKDNTWLIESINFNHQ